MNTREHGSGEPAITEHYKTLYYLIKYSVYDATLQVHGIIHNFTSLFFCFDSILKNPLNDLPNLLATKPRQIGMPEWLAKITCRNNLPKSSATPARGFSLPELGAIPARGIDLLE
jgi:hypothetical protein